MKINFKTSQIESWVLAYPEWKLVAIPHVSVRTSFPSMVTRQDRQVLTARRSCKTATCQCRAARGMSANALVDPILGLPSL